MIELCPKCFGQRHVNQPPYVPGDQPTWVSNDTRSHPCPVCRGSGYVAVVTESLPMLRARPAHD